MQALKVQFLGQEVTLVDNHGVPYVAMREIVLGIGLDWAGQTVKLNNNREKFSCCDISTTGADGKKYKMLCIPIKKLNGWLFSLNPNKVRPDLKERLENYQEECFLALWDYWTEGVARRDEVKHKMAEWEKAKAEYQHYSHQCGANLQGCKAKKQKLDAQFAHIQQMELFFNL